MMARFLKTRKAIAAVVLVAIACVGGTLAWITASGALTNTFGVGQVQPAVTETLASNVKKDVRVTNEGSVASYVRAQVNIYWRDADGNQLWNEPTAGESEDYTIDWGNDLVESVAANKWIEGFDGFYYWTSVVEPGDSTTSLIDSVTETADSPENELVVDIQVQAIQAEPTSAVTNAWGATVDESGVLTPGSGS